MAERAEDEPELRNILSEITRVIESGERIDTEEYLGRYPALAPELKQFFATRVLEGGDRETGLGVGSVIDDYRIKREIGRGGMGVVYEAEQISLGRMVALKVVPPNLLRGRSAADRFRREATAVARLSHARIVGVHGFNQTGGIAYLAMEYVAGIDLAEIIDRLRTARTHGRRFVRVSGPDLDQDIATWAKGRRLIGTMPDDPRIAEGVVLDLRNYAHMAAAIARDSADALRHAHSHGIIHRDIKPSNLILAENGRVKLSDFGLAKSVGEGSLTKTGDFIGSPAYVSPEQAASRRKKVDERSDIYSLGVTLYEMLTLIQPFSGKDVAVILRNILTKDPLPPTRLNPRVPRDLETIVLKAIEKDPDQRYQTAEELSDDLRRFLNFEPISARPLGPLARAGRAVRRHKVALSIGVMAAAIIVLSVLLATGAMGTRTRGVIAVRDISELLSQRGSDPVTEGVLDLVAELAADLPVEERRRRVDLLTQNARSLLDQGDFENVDRLLELLDAKAALGQWGELEQQLIENNILDVKIELTRRLEVTLRDPRDPPLSGRKRRAWLSILERLLDDADPLICKNAAVALGNVRDASSLGAMVDALTRREDVNGRVAIIGALAQLGSPAAFGFLAEQTHDSEEWVRYAALDALDTLDGMTPQDPLVFDSLIAHLATDEQPWIRERLAMVRASRAKEPAP
jgi:serine/threonine protein kinase